MYQIIDGKKVAEELKEDLRKKVSAMDEKPGLAVVLIGEDEASKVYVNLKTKSCEKVGIESYKFKLDENVSEDEVLALIDKLNKDDKINGILVQMPVPRHISKSRIMKAVIPEKDVDGFNPTNIGNGILDEPCLKACTPSGVIKLLKYYGVNIRGKEVTVIGKSIIVGKPAALMLMNEGGTVTVCHSATKDLKMHTQKADIIVSAVGRRNLVTADMVKEGAVVIDVGIIRDKGKLYGDIDFENVKDKCSHITPVPGGVGPMTVACLLENTLLAYDMQMKKRGDNDS